jgi:hypothetical protein
VKATDDEIAFSLRFLREGGYREKAQKDELFQHSGATPKQVNKK